MKRIEFFGISGSGKTYLKDILKKENNFFDNEEIIKKFLPGEEKNFFKKNLIKAYLIYKQKKKIKKKKFKTKKDFKITKQIPKISNFKGDVVNIYFKLLNIVFEKFKKKNLLFVKYNEQLIKKSNFTKNSKKIFLKWFKEDAVANYLSEKNRNKIHLVIDSEGFLQRLFIYLYRKSKKNKILEKYMKLYKFPYLVLITKDKCFLKKKHSNKEFNMSVLEQKKIYRYILKYLDKKKIPYKIVDKYKIQKLVF